MKNPPNSLQGYPQSMINNAVNSIISVLEHNGVDHSDMSGDEAQDKARTYSAPCNHKYDAPYKGGVTRKCSKCGGIQTN